MVIVSNKLTLLRHGFFTERGSALAPLARLRSERYFCQKARFLAKMIKLLRAFPRANSAKLENMVFSTL